MIANSNLTPPNPDEFNAGVVYPHEREDGKLLDDKSLHARAGWRHLMRAMKRGEDIPDEQYRANLAVAIELRDDPRRADTVRLRAAEFVNGLLEKGVDVAMHLDRIERDKQPVNVNIGLVLNIPAPKTRGDE